MSTQRLEDRGSFIPEEVRGDQPQASLSAPVTVAFGIASVVACALMVIGDGAGLTWIGAGLFVVLLWLFTWLSDRGIDRRSAQVDQWLEEAGEDVEDDGG